MAVKPNKIYALVSVLVALTLSACAGGSSSSSTYGQKDDVVRAIKVATVSAELEAPIKNQLSYMQNLRWVEEDGFAELTLVINNGGRPVSTNALIAKPKIVGILRQEAKPSYYRIEYTLLDNLGRTIEEEEVIGLGEDRQGFYPSLAPTVSSSQSGALQDALTQLGKSLQKTLAKNGMRGTVNMQLMANQVTVPVFERINLTSKHTFSVQNMPRTKLKFVGYMHSNNGQRQAILELTRGELPPLGSVVILNN